MKKRGIHLTGYMRRTFPLLTLFFLIGAIRFDFEPGVTTAYARAWVSIAGYVLGVGFVMLMGYVVIPWVWSRIGRLAVARRALQAVVPSSYENIPLHGASAIIAAVQAVIYVALAIFMPRIPSANAICIMISLFVMGYGFIRFSLPNLRFVVFALAVLVSGFVTVNSPYEHRYPEYGHAAYENPAPLPENGGKPNPALIDNDAAFDAWLRSARRGNEKPRLAVVATSGGGIRAAVWTASVLQRLSDGVIPDFPRHVRVISGASGGMVGAAFYVASLREGGDQEIEFQLMAADSLEPVARSMALRDIPSLFTPGHFDDRGVALEKAWQRNATAMKTTLGELAPGERAGWRPSLIFTPMFAEDGRRAVISNLELSFLGQNQGPQGEAHPTTYSRPAVELQRVLPSTSKLSVASIARMNASFPYVSPASELPTTPRRHVVDAGYWDNFGVSVSVDWLAHNFRRIVDDTSGVVLIQIRDSVQQPAYVDASVPREPGLALAGFSEFAAPLIAMLRARGAVMILRNDNEVQQISRAFAQATGNPRFFTTVVLENPETAVLSWSLTDRQAANMLDYFENHPDGMPSRRVEELSDWWVRAPQPVAAATQPVTAVLP